VRALSLEILKRRVDRGLYKRLDLLQRDVFWVLTRARRLSRTDSQAGGGFTCPVRLRIFYPVLLSSCCSLNMYLTAVNLTLSVGSFWFSPAPDISHALTARQEEVSPVQCACAPFILFCSLLVVYSTCNSLLLT
jgi:hypothetical protein